MKGKSFATEVLGELIDEVIDTNLILKFNTVDDEDEGEVQDVATMQQKLENYSQRFLDAILSSLDRIPLDLRAIANYLTQQTYKRWPDSEAVQGAISGLFFLRFFCPCIASPKSLGLRDPPLHCSNSLVIIGKVIQALANGLLSFKEQSQLMFMNDFLVRNRKILDRFVKLVSEWPPRTTISTCRHCKIL